MNENYRNGNHIPPSQQRLDDPYEDPDYGYRPAQARELSTFPPSVENRLAQARELLAQRERDAQGVPTDPAWTVVARTNPELMAIASMSRLGIRQLVVEEYEEDIQSTLAESYALGLRCGQGVRTVSNGTRRRRTYTLG
jgi:hypothetical protein